MLKSLVLVAGLVLPQLATAADLGTVRRHHSPPRRERAIVENGPAIRCTTTNLVLFSYSSCGQVFDPLAVAGN